MPENASPSSAAPASPAPGMRAPLPGLDILAFVCELFALGSLALWGFLAFDLPWNIVVGVGAPTLALVVWALFVSPRAVFAVHPFIRGLVELLVYLSATIAWWDLGYAWIGVVFAVIAVTCGVLVGRRRLS